MATEQPAELGWGRRGQGHGNTPLWTSNTCMISVYIRNNTTFWHFLTLSDTFWHFLTFQLTLFDTKLMNEHVCAFFSQKWRACQSVSERVRDPIDPLCGVSERVRCWSLVCSRFGAVFPSAFVCGVTCQCHLSHSNGFGAIFIYPWWLGLKFVCLFKQKSKHVPVTHMHACLSKNNLFIDVISKLCLSKVAMGRAEETPGFLAPMCHCWIWCMLSLGCVLFLQWWSPKEKKRRNPSNGLHARLQNQTKVSCHFFAHGVAKDSQKRMEAKDKEKEKRRPWWWHGCCSTWKEREKELMVLLSL